MNHRAFIEDLIAEETRQLFQDQGLERSEISGLPATASLKPFTPGALGNFPYFWQDPRNLLFNAKTYRWISSALLAGADPIQLAQPFTNIYTNVFSKLFYSLSTADQRVLRQARAEIQHEQGALLKAYQSAFGSLPPLEPHEEPIDAVIRVITIQWASPPTTLQQLQHAASIKSILNQVPPQGEPVIPALGNYLVALDQGLPLQNAVTMNTGYLVSALDAVQNPKISNGGLSLNDGEIVPAFAVATPLAQILAGLNSSAVHGHLATDLSVSKEAEDQFLVSSMTGEKSQAPLSAHHFASQLLRIESARGEDLLMPAMRDQEIASPIAFTLEFSGATMVYFGPSSFQASTHRNWFWPQPILDAITNKSRDVTGFKFSPQPQVDFGVTGPFAFLVGVAISRHPSVTLRAPNGSSVANLLDSFEPGAQIHLDLLGRRSGGTGESYVTKKAQSSEAGDVEILLEPADGGTSGWAAATSTDTVDSTDSVESTAFVLGVLPSYPAAG